MKHFLTTTLLLLISLSALSDITNHTIDIKTDKIVINTDSLDMPKSTTVYEALNILPDILERSKSFIFENYDIQINGKTVGSARDAVLQQIRIADLKCIEVSENTLSNVANMGQGGSISLELRDATKGLTGAVNAESSNEVNISGGLRLDNRNDKWTFRGVATIENYMPKEFELYNENSNTEKDRDFSEYAAAFIEFRPTKKDLLKLNVSEIYTNSRQWLLNNNTSPEIEKFKRTKNTNIFAALNYERNLSDMSKFCTEVNYRYIPEKYDGYDTTIDNAYSRKAHNIFGEAKFELNLITPTANRKAKMEIGAQYNYNSADNTKENSSAIAEENYLSTIENTYLLRPFVKVESSINRWTFMTNIDYQHFSYETKNQTSNKTDEHMRKNFTGQFVVMYAPSNRNLLRLRYIRLINRPKSTELFPYKFYDPVNQAYYQGNPNLNPARQNALDLDYCLNLSSSAYHLELKASIEYSHTYDEITPVVNTTSNHNYYQNLGKSDLILTDLGMNFRKGFFSLWLASNVYHKIADRTDTGNDNHYTYYNIFINPLFNLGRGWIASLRTTYNSSITTNTYDEGKQCFGNIRIGKTWKHLNAYIYATQNFSGKVTTTVYAIQDTTGKIIPYATPKEYSEEYMHSSFGAGIRYNF